MGICGTILFNLKNMKRAKKIRSLGRTELLAMDDEEFYNALHCVLYDTVFEINDPALNEPQKLAYTLINLETEVNNGGLCQFFVNSSRECAPYVSHGLQAVGAHQLQALYDDFISKNGIDVNNLSSFIIMDVEEYQAQTRRYNFDAFDDHFYDDCDLHQQIIDYLRLNLDQLLK